MTIPVRIGWNGRIAGYVCDYAHLIEHNGRIYQYPLTGEQYATFHNAGGRISIGCHPPMSFPADRALDHYDRLPTLARNLDIGEDQYGIWIAGRIRWLGWARYWFRQPNLSPDWRQINGRLELVAIVAIRRGKPRFAGKRA